MIRTQLQSLGLQLLLHTISSDRQLSCYQHLTLTQLYREREGTGCTSLHHPLSIVGSRTTQVSSFSLLPQSFSSSYQGAAIWRLGWIPCSESHTQSLGGTPPWVTSAQQTPFASVGISGIYSSETDSLGIDPKGAWQSSTLTSFTGKCWDLIR